MTRIAIVEDNKVIRESLESYVRTDPELTCVSSCATAEAAVRILPGLHPDIVLMDIQLPHQSGIECAAQLKALLPAVKILMVTIYADPERIFKALRAGACGYLLKRCQPEELIAAIREVREGGAPMSREIACQVIASFQQPATAAAEVEDLSTREREILDLLAGGCTNKEISARLGLSEGTVRWHLSNVYNKLHVRTRTEAVLKLQSAKASHSN
jgi:DNA-binding NarL/FixJ family response regulator